MATTAQEVKQKRLKKELMDGKRDTYTAKVYNRCRYCGRPRGYMRQFGMCRICFRNLAHKGKIPGVVKSSW